MPAGRTAAVTATVQVRPTAPPGRSRAPGASSDERRDPESRATFRGACASEGVVIMAEPIPTELRCPTVRDDAAYAEVFSATHGPLVRLAWLLTGDVEDAGDLVAEAFARVYPKWRDGRVGDVEAYLRTALVNGVRGRARRRVVARRAAARAGGIDPYGAFRDDEGVERDRLRRALARLPVRQRTVLVLRFFEDRGEADIAAILGTSVGTVKSQVSRGLDRLRTVLGEQEADE